MMKVNETLTGTDQFFVVGEKIHLFRSNLIKDMCLWRGWVDINLNLRGALKVHFSPEQHRGKEGNEFN